MLTGSLILFVILEVVFVLYCQGSISLTNGSLSSASAEVSEKEKALQGVTPSFHLSDYKFSCDSISQY
jgi:hypothetical protein